MQEKQSVMVVRFELKILSLGMTVLHHSASLVMPNSYPCGGIFIPNLTTIRDSYILVGGILKLIFASFLRVGVL